jgi:hypothetical protein
LSNTEQYRVAAHSTAVRNRAGKPVILLAGSGLELATIPDILQSDGYLIGRIKKTLGITAREAKAQIAAWKSLIPSGERISTPQRRCDAAATAHVWNTDKIAFATQLKAALRAYVLVPPSATDLPPAQRSAVTSDETIKIPRRTVPLELKAASEHFVDSAIIGVIRTSNAVDSLAQVLRSDAKSFTKFMTILVEHFFRDKRLLRDVAKSAPYDVYPNGFWKQQVAWLLAMDSRGPRQHR